MKIKNPLKGHISLREGQIYRFSDSESSFLGTVVKENGELVVRTQSVGFKSGLGNQECIRKYWPNDSFELIANNWREDLFIPNDT
jgi:hypothetical protein